MTAEQQRIAIATAVGWTNVKVSSVLRRRILRCDVWGNPPNSESLKIVPNYPADLNPCAEFEKTLSDREWEKYVALLSQGITRTWWEGARAVCRAKAEQRCIAFLRVKGIIQ